MGMEQFEISPENTEETSPPVEQKSKIIRGPWPERETIQENVKPFAHIPPEERHTNVIKGPWEKVEISP